jgi:hypothetical protein
VWTDADAVPRTTDQKVGGSSPSEGASSMNLITGLLPHPPGACPAASPLAGPPPDTPDFGGREQPQGQPAVRSDGQRCSHGGGKSRLSGTPVRQGTSWTRTDASQRTRVDGLTATHSPSESVAGSSPARPTGLNRRSAGIPKSPHRRRPGVRTGRSPHATPRRLELLPAGSTPPSGTK